MYYCSEAVKFLPDIDKVISFEVLEFLGLVIARRLALEKELHHLMPQQMPLLTLLRQLLELA